MTENPWKIKSQEIIFDNPWISLKGHDVINPAGNEGRYTFAHFKNYAIGILPIDENHNIWLVGQYRFPTEEYSWEIPMGGGPLHLDILDSAKRELLEETGLKAEHWTLFGRVQTSNSVTDEIGYIYLAQGLTQHEAEPEETEILQVKKVPLAEAVDMVMNNEITDAISVIAILKAEKLLKK